MGKRMATRVMAVVALGAALAASPATAATATFSYPANGGTVALDGKLRFNFRWTLPPGETYPDVYVGNSPGYDASNQFDPFGSWCGGQAQIASSCQTGFSEAGAHYAVIATSPPGGDGFTFDVSPEIRFTVPARVGLGCAPGSGCASPRLQNFFFRFGDAAYGWPYTGFYIWAWTNAPKESFAFTLRHGRRLLVRSRTYTEAGFREFDTPEPGSLQLKIHHVRGIAPGTALSLGVVIRGGSARYARSFTVRAGGVPASGVSVHVE